MQVEKQVVSIFAGTNGYLDEIPMEHVQRFERELLEMMELKHRDLLNEIAGRVAKSGGRVESVGLAGGQRLRELGGVGAFLRF